MPGKRWLRVALGLVLLLPAIACCLSTLALPTLSTALNSLQRKSPMRPGQAEFTGLGNYGRLFEDRMLAQALGPTLSLLLVRLLVAAVVPLLLAFLVNEFGRGVRIPVRLLFTVPLALFTPVAAGVGWWMVLAPQTGLINTWLRSVGLEPVGWLVDPGLAPISLMLVEGLATFGVAYGAGLVVYLATLRGAGEGVPAWRRVWLPLLVSWGVGMLTVVAVPLPAFDTSYVLTGGGPANATLTLGIYLFKVSFAFMDVGYGSAIAVLLLIVTMVIGLFAGLAIVFGGLRLEMVPWRKRSGLLTGEGKPGWIKTIAVVLLSVVLLFSLVLCALSGLPWAGSVVASLRSHAQLTLPESPFWPAERRTYVYEGQEHVVYRVPTEGGIKEWALVKSGRTESYFVDPANPGAGLIRWGGVWHTLAPVWVFSLKWENYREMGTLMPPSIGHVWVIPPSTAIGHVWANTILPPLAVILALQLSLAYLGALGIGALRPLGKWSEVLLLLFTPWLFVTTVPLSLALFETRVSAELIDTWGVLASPIVFSVPMLFVLTLFFKGREPKWRAAQAGGGSPAGTFFAKLVLPSLPLVAMLVCVSLLLGMQDLWWQMIVARGPETHTACVALFVLFQQYTQQAPAIAAAASVVLGLLPSIFFFLAFGALQVFYMDRLALVSHGPEDGGKEESVDASPQTSTPAGDEEAVDQGDRIFVSRASP